MKKLFKKIILLKLFFFARLQLLLARPFVIAIIGTSNRTLVKEIVVEELSKKISVHTNEPQWNAEIGIPLTILRTNVSGHSFIGWFITLVNAFLGIFRGAYPKILVVEVAFNARGDMSYMSRLLKPHAVVINDMQSLDGSYFVNEKEALVHEYLAMVRQGNKKDIVIINTELPEKERIYKATRRKVFEYVIDNNTSPYSVSSEMMDARQKIHVTTPKSSQTYQTSIPGNAVKAAYAVATILRKVIDI